MSDAVAQAAARLAARGPLRLGVVLGSGLDAVAARVDDAEAIPYGELPGFPRTSVQGHPGRAVLGTLGGQRAAILQGRAHAYEGGDPEVRRVPVRALRRAGAELVVLTNAAGSLRPEVGPGSLMAIADHIDLSGSNPLIGANDDAIGPRFPSLLDAYDPALRTLLHEVAVAAGLTLHEGVYVGVAGPSYETPAEIRALRLLGADAVGMSTVSETIVARHCGLRVAAVSLITNLAEGLGATALSHEQAFAEAARGGDRLGRLLEAFAAALPER